MTSASLRGKAPTRKLHGQGHLKFLRGYQTPPIRKIVYFDTLKLWPKIVRMLRWSRSGPLKPFTKIMCLHILTKTLLTALTTSQRRLIMRLVDLVITRRI